MGTIAENIAGVKAKIAKLRPEAQLIAVSKTYGEAEIRQAIMAGQKLFGENRVQEAAGKFPALRKEFPDLRLHLIGPLQSNKVKEALELFDVIQTLDREKLAVAISKTVTPLTSPLRGGGIRCREFFIQVNIGEEEQKAGVDPKQAEEFFKFCTQDLKLNITGLMCIPPVGEPAFMYFALLQNLKSKIGNLKLSMGMSADYEQALEMGADYVRVGSAIFGERS